MHEEDQTHGATMGNSTDASELVAINQDLLAALKAALVWVAMGMVDPPLGHRHPDGVMHARKDFALVTAAIARAEGK